MNSNEIKILAIESSCDETAAAVVVNGRDVRSNVISSQIALHTLYGGVVPEIASRKHIEKINQVIGQALSDAGMTLDDMDAIGVTYGPGLVGALLVGVAEAKAISYAKKLPLVGVHHIEGHISANYIENKDLEPPFLCLVVSGGHTHLVKVLDYGKYEILGKTRDDAAGEAFDKVARAIGLGYPGGPKIEKVAHEGNPHAVEFPRAKIVDGPYDFSFSGLKSAVLNYLNGCKMKNIPIVQADIAASFQKAVTDVLIGNAMKAIDEFGMDKFAIAGGVASNGTAHEIIICRHTDHRRIIGTENGGGMIKCYVTFSAFFLKRCPQGRIRSHAAGNGKFIQSISLHCMEGMAHQHIYDCFLEGSSHIRLINLFSLHLASVQIVQHCGFQTAEAEIIFILRHCCSGEVDGIRIAHLRHLVNLGTAGISQSDGTSHLVKSFSRRIISGPSDDLIFTVILDHHQM